MYSNCGQISAGKQQAWLMARFNLATLQSTCAPTDRYQIHRSIADMQAMDSSRTVTSHLCLKTAMMDRKSLCPFAAYSAEDLLADELVLAGMRRVWNLLF